MRPALFVLLLAPAGCYSYVPTEASRLSAPEFVRVELTDDGSRHMTAALGEQVQYVEGPVVRAGQSEFTLAVKAVRRRSERLYKEWPGDSIRIPQADVRDMQIKTQSRGKTAAAVTVGAVSAIALVVVAARAVGLAVGGNGKQIPTPAAR